MSFQFIYVYIYDYPYVKHLVLKMFLLAFRKCKRQLFGHEWSNNSDVLRPAHTSWYIAAHTSGQVCRYNSKKIGWKYQQLAAIATKPHTYKLSAFVQCCNQYSMCMRSARILVSCKDRDGFLPSLLSANATIFRFSFTLRRCRCRANCNFMKRMRHAFNWPYKGASEYYGSRWQTAVSSKRQVGKQCPY